MALTDVKYAKALDYAAGAVDRNGAIVDTQGYKHVRAVVHFAAVATGATTSVKIQSGDASDLSDAAFLADASVDVTDADDNDLVIIEIENPVERYIRVVIDKDTANETAECAHYVLSQPYGFRRQPVVSTVANEIDTLRLVRPAEAS